MEENSIERLKNLRKEIDDAKAEEANVKGHIESLLSTLKEEFDVDDIEQAEKLQKELEEKKKKLEEELEEGISKLEEEYEW